MLVSCCWYASWSSSSAHALQSAAVIGGGVAGLSCAQHLQNQYDVTVFDTGRLRPGGRASSRRPGDDDTTSRLNQCIVDHAAQILSVPEGMDDFAAQVEVWKKDGVVQPFPENSLYRRVNGELRPLSTKDQYYGTQGMASVVDSLAKGLDIRQDVWVSPSSGARYMPSTKQWKLSASGQVLGYYDHLVIAHNGKCADRLMSKTPAKEIHELLKVNFHPSVPAHGGKRMTLNSLHSLTIVLSKESALSRSLPDTFFAGFWDHKDLRMVTCQSRKYPNDEQEVWTLFSSPQFAKKFKAPQEFLPEEVVEDVTDRLLRALEESLDLVKELQPLESRLQLWGAAVPLNVWDSEGFLYDAEHSVGVCGDWLVEASLGGAWTSGKRLADHMKGSKTTAGLQGRFVVSEATKRAGIGSIPTGNAATVV